MRLCQKKSSRRRPLPFPKASAALSPIVGVLSALALTAAAGCGGSHSSSAPVNTAGYSFTNFDYTNATGGTTLSGINNNGVVVGFTTAATQPYTNFIRNVNGSFTVLKLINGTADVSNTATTTGINDSGTVVGTVTGMAFEAAGPFLAADSVTTLPLVTATATTQSALGINNSGVIVGQYFESATGTTPGFVYANRTYTVLDPAPVLGSASGVTNPQGINNNGVVVGMYAVNGSTFQHGFVYDMTSAKYTFLPDPATARITANGIATVRFLGINDSGEAAGYYQTTNGSQYAFVFDVATQTYTYLDDPGAAVATAYSNKQTTRILGINNSAEICGTYTDASFIQHGFTATIH